MNADLSLSRRCPWGVLLTACRTRNSFKYDAVAAFDRDARRAFVEGRSRAAVDALVASLARPASPAAGLPDALRVRSNFARADYEASVRALVARIFDGEFYQANMTQRLQIEFDQKLSAYALFARLCETSASPYAALVQCAGGAVISNSPERFFRLDPRAGARRLHVAPIKGTRRRGRTLGEDRAVAAELVNDEKERAENVMIADLLRNDLSRICKDHSLVEEAICVVETFAHVHHLVSRISADLRDDVDVFDVFDALFPCGSITGAPKIQSMIAIDEVERGGRGPYCGAIGFVDDGGYADFAVAIRTLIVEDEEAGSRLSVPVGGGVTALSDPSAEYEETLLKAKGAAPVFAPLFTSAFARLSDSPIADPP